MWSPAHSERLAEALAPTLVEGGVPDPEPLLPPDTPPDGPRFKRSSVAAVLDLASSDGPRVLLMRRVERSGDPWSGHVSLPGGRREPEDATLLETAVRETREEVGVDLAAASRALGRLDPLPAVGRGRRLAMDITPYVFVLEREVAPGLSDEAAEVFWLPLAPAAAGALDAEHAFDRHGVVHRVPCWRFEERTVWGLTYHVLSGLLELARPS